MEQHFWKRTGPRRLAFTGVLLVAGALVFASKANADHDRDDESCQHGFTDASIRGRYAFSVQGELNSAPAAAIGFLIIDGRGHITSAERTLNVGGTIFQQTFMCSYHVDADGTGTTDCTIDDGTREVTDFVVVGQGNEILFLPKPLPDSPSFVLFGSAKRK
ncbi:hypothetical protein WME90_33280 [Sorangium sp. So ce375]|uniref:hypothetical protein n=1 Tax=Sorangium sp. So ce375 TaxID=3133306 RepID=UPI003F5BF9CE